MSVSPTVNSLFPAWEDVPEPFQMSQYKDGLRYLIGGDIFYAEQGTEVRSPILLKENGQLKASLIGSVPLLRAETSQLALQTAVNAFGYGSGQWACMKVEERIERIEEFARCMQQTEEIFACLEMWEIGKPLKLCRDEFERTLKYIQDTIGALRKLDKDSSIVQQVGEFAAQVKRCPLGITLCMGPFNYPLNETFAMLIPALIMGNPVIMKPPRYGALCTVPMMPFFADVFPPGVVNIINGDGAEIITPIISSGQIAVLGFIGSSKVANILVNQHPANNRLRTILGLEAKNPAFIFPDADLKLAVKECLQGALEFNGQRCTAIKHIWVHQDIADQFLSLFSAAVDGVKCGMPWEDNVMITPLPEENKAQWLNELVDDACSKGARIVNRLGGKSEETIYYPTVLYPVDAAMKVYTVEQFGPVIPVSTFRDLDELEGYLQSSGYGQQASIFSSTPETAAPLIDILVNQVSRINLNAQCRRGPDDLPFTGRKDSAEGTLSVTDALRSFSIRSLVVANEQGKELFFSVLASGKSRFLTL